jgi:putative ABC transport system ATP-binding protein
MRSLSSNGLTTIMITHNPELAARAGRTVHIRDGAVHP